MEFARRMAIGSGKIMGLPTTGNLQISAAMNCYRLKKPWLPGSAACLAIALLISGPLSVSADDWPMWRFNASRTADSKEKLPANLKLVWSREYTPRVPAWEDPLNQDLMPFDSIFEPIAVGNFLLLGFNDTDKLVALDIRTGREAWAFYTDGPVRLAPAAAGGKVYFTSDDGHLYCVRIADGSLVWKFRGGPSDRKALGNGRLISVWPARGGAVVRDGTVYFAASIWPFMGVFIYALDAETGAVQWVNDGSGSRYMKQPHNAPAFAGIAPQGCLVAADSILLVPGGRSVPAGFNRQTGDLLYYHLAESGKGTGGSTVMAGDDEYFVHTRQNGVRWCDLKTGRKSSSFALLGQPVLGKGSYYVSATHGTNYNALAEARQKLADATYAETKARNDLADALAGTDAGSIRRLSNTWQNADNRLKRYQKRVAELSAKPLAKATNQVIQAWNANKTLRWELPADGSGDLIRADRALYAAGLDQIIGIQLPAGRLKPSIFWSHPVPDGQQVRRLLAANSMLFAVTRQGRILAFGANSPSAAPAPLKSEFKALKPAPAALEEARALIEKSGAADGYALCLGLGDGELFSALVHESQLHVIGVDADADKVKAWRQRLDAANLYGQRAALLTATPQAAGMPPYFANLVVVDKAVSSSLAEAATARAVFESVRPYGGALWAATDDVAGLAEKLAAAALPAAKITPLTKAVLVTREGPLPGSAPWTHQYGDVANSVKSDDQTVKLPLGLLWFGGNTHLDVLPRHGHGPSEQVAGGRLFIEGMDCLSARDVYTGRRLWKTVIPGLDTSGIYHDDTHLDNPLTTLYNQRHIPGANARGANYVVTADRVYVAVSNHCVVLDAADGRILQKIELPSPPGQAGRSEWGYIGICDDVLLGGADFARFSQRFGAGRLAWPPPAADFAASQRLVAFDRLSGKVLWSVDARHAFIHNGIVAGQGRVYCLDRLLKSAESKIKQSGQKAPANYRIAAFDLRSGRQLWEQTNQISGTWLGYSKKHDLLLQAGASATDRLKDEASQGMSVLRAADGSYLWKRPELKYKGPCILYHDLIITTPGSYQVSAGAFNLLDGKPHTIVNPLTGELQPWRFHRTYGCNTPVAAEHLLTFRSGAAGFYDLLTHSGTGNLGGFKSGCSANLIIADGVLNAPDYTRTCSCPYQNQTSLAFVPMPEMEVWTCNSAAFDTPEGKRIKRLGLNFGAPGDRLAETGTLWLEYPFASGLSAKLALTLQYFPNATTPHTYRRHASAMAAENHDWVFASGIRDLHKLTLAPQTLAPLPHPVASGKDEDDDDDDESLRAMENNGTTNHLAQSTNDFHPFPTNSPAPAQTFDDLSHDDNPFHNLAPLPPATYTVRLYFAEPDDIPAGQRVFDVYLQERRVLAGFDPRQEAGAPRRGVVKEFKGVVVPQTLVLRLEKSPGAALGPVISGLELIAE